MAIKQEKELTLTRMAIRDVVSRSNPLAETPEGGIAENIVSYRGRLVRIPYPPVFSNNNDTSRVWKIFEFKFFRNSAAETQLIIARASGKIYKRSGGDEIEIFPGTSGFSLLSAKPSIVSIANRMHVTDGAQYLIWNGWFWVKAGLNAPAAPTTSLAGGALTGTFDICVTAAFLDEGIQIHESTRSAITTVSPAAQNITVNQPTLDAKATHWNVYISEIDSAGLRMRRVATVPITSASTVISALPATTNPFAPIRNDPPQANRVLFNWKNRLGMGDRTDGRNFWFTAFEEVAGNFNGAPEECVPGRGTSSLSDIVNSWTLPDRGETLQGGCWHENFAFLGTDRNGYVVQGEGGLLDDRALRDFYPLKAFSFGTCGPWGMISTPHGLVNFSPEHKLTLWEGGQDVTDLGEDIQADLDTINGSDLYETELLYWNGNGRDWLIVCSPGLNGKLYIYDFASVISQPQGGQQRGAWCHYITSGALLGRGDPSSVCVYHDGSQPILLLGTNSAASGVAATLDVGAVLQMDTECQPAHLGLSFILSTVYLGSSVLTAAQTFFRTSEYAPSPERFVRAKYFTVTHRLEQALNGAAGQLTETQSRSATTPELFLGFDQVGIGQTTTPSFVSLATNPTRLTDGSQRFWLGPKSNGSLAGVLCKRLFVEGLWATSDSLDLDGSGRRVAHNNEILNFQLAWMPTDLLAQ